MLPSAPDVTIHGPTAVFAGREVQIGVEVTAKESTKVDYIEVRVLGKEGWTIGSGKHQISQRLTFPDLIARVMEAGTLPVGTSRFDARFALPINVPPSHALTPAFARLQLKVHVSIPWWLDGRSWFELPVRLAPGGPVVRTPIASRTEVTGDTDAPRLELSLASSRLIAGETLVGSCAVFHLDDRKPREVKLTLTPLLSLHKGSRTRERTGSPLTTSITVPAGGGGIALPFRFELPKDLTPTFAATTHSLRWALGARTGSLLGGRVGLALPIEIVDASATAHETTLTAAPALGDKRVVAVFAAFAAGAGWRTTTATGSPAAADDDDDEDRSAHLMPAVTRDVGDAALAISYAYRGTEGAVLVARLGSPPLGLGLRVTPGSTMRHVFFRDVEVGITAWDRDHLVVARSAAQTMPFLTAMVPALIEAPHTWPGTLVRWDDDGLVFERPVTTVEHGHLVAMAAALERLAAALATAQRAIAPPPGIELDVATWHELVGSLRGRTSLGDLTLTGELGGTQVEVELGWEDDVPIEIKVRVGDPAHASAEARAATIALARPADQALMSARLGTGFSGEIAERLTAQLVAWPADIHDLRVADGIATATIPLATGGTPRLDPARVRALIEALRTLLVTLEPGASPYR